MASASLGVKPGAAKSLAVAGEVLFYVSRAGVVAYSGGIPQNIATPLGRVDLENTVGGSDGRKYYLSCYDTVEDKYCAYVYDTEVNLWQIETMPLCNSAVWHNGVYFLTQNGELWCVSGNNLPNDAVEESRVESYVEFGDFVENNPNKKGTAKIQLRVELEPNASLSVQMMFDSDGRWQEISTLRTPIKRSYYLPIIPRRCDHFKIRLSGNGKWTLYSLVRESYSGSEI